MSRLTISLRSKMNLENMRIRQGARLSFTVEQGDSNSISATFIAESDTYSFYDTVDYVNGVAAFQFDSPDTDYVGVYKYQVNENFATGSPDIYPNMADCDGDCDLPTLEICESLQIGS